MARLIADLFLTLDGVAQAPGSPNEDTEGGFRHGGWHHDHADEAVRAEVLRNTREADAYLFGRRTFEIFAAFWPRAGGDLAALAEPLNTRPKYVVTSTLTAPLAWAGAEPLAGEPADSVSALLARRAGDVHLVGSPQLTAALLARDLVDEVRLVIDPVLVGGGKRAFPLDGGLRRLRMTSSEVTRSGAVIARYAPQRQERGPRVPAG